MTRRDDDGRLAAVIQALGSTLDVEQLLRSLVRGLVDATGCRACRVSLDDASGERVVRATLGAFPEQLTRHRAVAGDDEPLARVPLQGRSGRAIGEIELLARDEQPFGESDRGLLEAVASLAAGAIENARAYDEVRGRVGLLESLSRLAETVSRAESLDVLLPAVVARTATLLRASLVQIYLLEEAEGRLRLRAAAPASTDAPSLVSLRAGGRRGERLDAGDTLANALFGSVADASALLVPLIASGELLGFVAARAGADLPFGEDARDLATSLANQTADAIKKIRLIERLTERNQLKDFFEDLGRGAPDGLVSRGRRLGVDLERPHLVLWARRFGDDDALDIAGQLERLEGALARTLSGSVCDRRDGGLRVLVPLGAAGERDALARLGALRSEVAPDVVVGVSNPCTGVDAYVTGFAEALQAVSAAPVVQEHAATVTFDDLGPYKYLLRVSQEGLVRDRHADALRSLLDYDRARQAQLVRTLEEYLRQRGNVSATAQALYVHPNTLRQRLRRITELTRLDVRTDDWLMIEIALKLLRLEDLLGVAERVPAA
ncbi:MAG TPA: helix-turn-helix domain-containing protein [Gaiellales bacterium]|jgi:GAF domain-containing protein